MDQRDIFTYIFRYYPFFVRCDIVFVLSHSFFANPFYEMFSNTTICEDKYVFDENPFSYINYASVAKARLRKN